MRNLNSSLQKVFKALEHKHGDVLKITDELYEALNNLNLGGKMFFTKNMKIISADIRFFKKELFPHINFDEKIIFPFVSMHIPRLENMLYFLRAEHVEIKNNFSTFEGLFKKLHSKKEKKPHFRDINRFIDRGTYLFCLLRSHIQTENTSVYKEIEKQLNRREKEELAYLYRAFKG